MSEIAVIGAGAWGTAIVDRAGPQGIASRAPVGARKGSLRDHRRRHGQRTVSSRPASSPIPSLPPTTSQSTARRGVVVSVMPSQHCRALFEQMRPHLRPEMLIRQRDQRPGGGSLLRMTEVITEVLGGAASSAAHRRAERPDVRARRSPAAIRPQSPLRRRMRELARHGAERIQRSPLPGLHQRRRDRRGTGRGVEEHHRHRRRSLRRTWPGTQLRRRADHPRAGGDHAAGGGLRRARGNHGRDWPDSATWCSPAPAASRATAASASNWAAAASCRRSSPACTAWSRKESSPPPPRSGWRGLAASKCRSPSRCTPSCTRASLRREAIHELMTRSGKSEV